MWPSFGLQSGEHRSLGISAALSTGCGKPSCLDVPSRLNPKASAYSSALSPCELVQLCSHSKNSHVDYVVLKPTGLQGCPKGASPASGHAVFLTVIGWQAHCLPLML